MSVLYSINNIKKIIVLFIGSLLAISVSYEGMASGLWYVIFLLGLVSLNRQRLKELFDNKNARVMVGLVFMYLLYSFFINYSNGMNELNKSRVERELYLVGIPIAVVFLQWLKPNERLFLLSFSVSSIVFAYELYKFWLAGAPGRMDGVANAIYYGNTALLVSLMCIAGAYTYKRSKVLMAWMVLSSFIAFLAFLFSGSRGGVLSLVALVIFWFLFYLVRKPSWKIISSLSGILILLLLIILCSPPVQKRVEYTIKEMETISSGSYQTSIGYRLLMWDAAISVFKENPIFGSGYSAYKDEMKRRGDDGQVIYKHILKDGSDPHNQILHQAAAKGVVGVAIYTVLLLFPFLYFLGMVGSRDLSRSLVSMSMVSFYVLFVLFGLTITLLDQRKIIVIFGLYYAYSIYFMLFWSRRGVSDE